MVKGIRDYGAKKLSDYSREDHGESRFIVEPDVVAKSNRPDGDAPRPPKNSVVRSPKKSAGGY